MCDFDNNSQNMPQRNWIEKKNTYKIIVELAHRVQIKNNVIDARQHELLHLNNVLFVV